MSLSQLKFFQELKKYLFFLFPYIYITIFKNAVFTKHYLVLNF